MKSRPSSEGVRLPNLMAGYGHAESIVMAMVIPKFRKAIKQRDCGQAATLIQLEEVDHNLFLIWDLRTSRAPF